MSEAPLRVGILSVAHLHADGYLGVLRSMPGVALVGLWDDDEARGAETAARYETRFFPSQAALLAERVDAVVITSVNRDHRRLTELAAAAGVHVLCEKPLATRAEDARAIVEACATAGVLLMTAFPMRFSPVLLELERAIRSGVLGELACLEGVNSGQIPDRERAWFTDPALAGGGAVTDHVVHLADLYRWLLDSEVVEVYAVSNRILRDRFANVETGGLVSLRFENGVFATIDCSWSKPPSYPTWGGLTIEAVGSDGVITADAFRQRLEVYGSGEPAVSWPGWGSGVDVPMFAEFAAAIRERRQPAVTGLDGLRAVEIVEAAYRSIESGEPVGVRRSEAPAGVR